MTRTGAVNVLVGLAMMTVIVTGGLDLSVGRDRRVRGDGRGLADAGVRPSGARSASSAGWRSEPRWGSSTAC